LSDAQGRRVTPRIIVDFNRAGTDAALLQTPTAAPRGRGRPPKNKQEQEAREAQERLVSQKRRSGGPGMDRGGATLVNDKRRKGFSDNDGVEEELVDVED
jgi:predicted DNA-binding WGR domain protein